MLNEVNVSTAPTWELAATAAIRRIRRPWTSWPSGASLSSRSRTRCRERTGGGRCETGVNEKKSMEAACFILEGLLME